MFVLSDQAVENVIAIRCVLYPVMDRRDVWELIY